MRHGAGERVTEQNTSQVESTPDESDNNLAPRPRPGFRSHSDFDTAAKTQLAAGVMRAVLGAVGFAASLLYVPVTMATPILAGVGVLMMVTGTTSTWRAARLGPRRATHVVLAFCAVAVVVSCALAAWLGPGAFSPVRGMSHPSDGPVIHFEPPPGR
jgi:hypothetical protein